MTATSANPLGVQVVREFGVAIGFGKWLVVAAVPALTALLLLPWVVARIFPPGIGKTPERLLLRERNLRHLVPSRVMNG